MKLRIIKLHLVRWYYFKNKIIFKTESSNNLKIFIININSSRPTNFKTNSVLKNNSTYQIHIFKLLRMLSNQKNKERSIMLDFTNSMIKLKYEI